MNEIDMHDRPLRHSTLVFLVKKSNRQITQLCLAMKKRGFGMGRWNGVGGKVETDETIEEAMIRETHEEIGVEVLNFSKIAELSFFFSVNSSWNQLVHVYFAYEWAGEPMESEEMRPQWFEVVNLPFDSMWPDDRYWLPEVISGKLLKAKFVFGDHDAILDMKIDYVNSLKND